MLDGEGIESGVSLRGADRGVRVAAPVLGRELPGLLYKAGLNHPSRAQ